MPVAYRPACAEEIERAEELGSQELRDRLGLIGLEFAQEELVESSASVFEEAAVLFRKQSANRRR